MVPVPDDILIELFEIDKTQIPVPGISAPFIPGSRQCKNPFVALDTEFNTC
jgi:hypothetical protein